jgi:hypothetical protein
MTFNGLGMHMGNLSLLSDARTRSLSPENFDGSPSGGGRATEGTGAGPSRDLGEGWKVSPSVVVPAHGSFELANIEGPGAIQQIWMTPIKPWRRLILRIWWDDQEHPSVECPIGDFFACGWETFAQVSSLAVCVNPGSGFNSYWEMPFRRRCRMTLTNRSDDNTTVYYQVNYTLTEVPEDAGYFHAQFRRSNPIPYKEVHTLLDGVIGRGHYVGTYMCWGSNSTGWWGEGEIKFYLDGEEWPTLCGTGVEDYFCGAYGFVVDKKYVPFTTPYAGMPQVITPDGLFRSQTRFGLYRWHIVDPIRFESGLNVTIQALGWRSGGRYLPLQDDIASVSYWYQTLPTAPFPELGTVEELEVI